MKKYSEKTISEITDNILIYRTAVLLLTEALLFCLLSSKDLRSFLKDRAVVAGRAVQEFLFTEIEPKNAPDDGEVVQEDTRAPFFLTGVQKLLLRQNERYDLSMFLPSIAVDSSGSCRVYLQMPSGEKTSIFDTSLCGDHRYLLVAEDETGNRTERVVSTHVGVPDTLLGVHEIYVKQSEEAYKLPPVFACNSRGAIRSAVVPLEETDNEITPAEPGEYVVTYLIEDAEGFLTKEETAVHVTKDEAEVRAHRGDYRMERPDRQKIADLGYFAYEALPTADRETTIELAEPTLVSLTRRIMVSDTTYTEHYGSGVIYRVTGDRILILSVEHVTKLMREGDVTLRFFDGTEIKYSLTDDKRLSEENEITLFSVPAEELPYDTWIRLKEACRSNTVYSSLQKGDALLKYAKWYRGGAVEDLIVDSTFLRLGIPDVFHKDLGSGDAYFTSEAAASQGMSGTGIFDLCGHLVGIVDVSMEYWEMDETGKKTTYHWDGDARIDTLGLFGEEGP